MKKILITGGPTNEPIDEVMKITNMSTGSLSVNLCRLFAKEGWKVTGILNRSVAYGQIEEDNVKILPVETTDEMMKSIEEEGALGGYDALIHAAAVGDYKSDFTFLLEDMAEEIYGSIDKIQCKEDVLNILRNPICKIDDSSKISSYQENLTVKLGLTPKIIGSLRDWFPDTLIVGCKLLENTPHEELLGVAQALAIKNNVDYIFANDLAKLRDGDSRRYPVSQRGDTGQELREPEDILKFIVDRCGSQA